MSQSVKKLHILYERYQKTPVTVLQYVFKWSHTSEFLEEHYIEINFYHKKFLQAVNSNVNNKIAKDCFVEVSAKF